MDKLKPNVKYIFERVDQIIYAREFGSDPKTRFVYLKDCEPDDFSKDLSSNK